MLDGQHALLMAYQGLLTRDTQDDRGWSVLLVKAYLAP